MMMKIERASGRAFSYILYALAAALGFLLAFITVNGGGSNQLFGESVGIGTTAYADAPAAGTGGTAAAATADAGGGTGSCAGSGACGGGGSGGSGGTGGGTGGTGGSE